MPNKTLCQICKFVLPVLVLLLAAVAGKSLLVWVVQQDSLAIFLKLAIAAAALAACLAVYETLLDAEGFDGV